MVTHNFNLQLIMFLVLGVARWLAMAIGQRVVEGGTSRCLFVVGGKDHV